MFNLSDDTKQLLFILAIVLIAIILLMPSTECQEQKQEGFYPCNYENSVNGCTPVPNLVPHKRDFSKFRPFREVGDYDYLPPYCGDSPTMCQTEYLSKYLDQAANCNTCGLGRSMKDVEAEAEAEAESNGDISPNDELSDSDEYNSDCGCEQIGESSAESESEPESNGSNGNNGANGVTCEDPENRVMPNDPQFQHYEIGQRL